MSETPFYFETGDYSLFAVLHEPELTSVSKVFVFCHPFAEEKLWTHRVYVNMARELCQRGYAVLRFDYMGNGDSDGVFEDSTVKTNIADINAAIEYVKTKYDSLDEINLLGLRLGATYACHVALQRKDISQLILWDPILDGSRYMQEILRSNLTTQMAVYGKVTKNRETLINEMREGKTVNFDGYDLGETMFNEGSALNILNGDSEFSGKVLIVQIGKQGQPINKNLQKFKTRFSTAEICHAVEEPFWREIKQYYSKAKDLFQLTSKWVEQV